MPGSRIVLGALLWMWPAVALAQVEEGPRESTAAAGAIAAGQRGVRAYELGNWSEALQSFREADTLYHSPVFALFAARCQRRLGQLLEARTVLNQLANEPLAATAPAPWVKARSDARVELAELASEVPTVTLLIEGGSPAARLTLDDQPVEPGHPIELNPGEHRAAAVVGTGRHETSFNVAAGTHSRVALGLAASGAPRPSDPTKKRPAPTPPAAAPDRGPYLPGWMLAGAGALGLISGGVVGILALDKRSSLRRDLPEGCEQDRCVELQKSAIEAHFKPANDLALASDILWISGAVLATGGIALIVIDPRPRTTATLSVSPAGGTFRMQF
jgi:hypothetical protein